MVSFDTNGVKMPDLDNAKIFRWIEEVATLYDRRVGNLAYCFCNDDAILETNRQFLDHDYFTDIITFDYSYGDRIEGDILISLDTVASNAEELNLEYNEELLRVIIHGVLHLCGLKDKSPEERKAMESAENEALSLYKAI